MSFKYGAIYMFSASAIAVGNKVAESLAKNAWLAPDGLARNSTIRYLPQSLARCLPPCSSGLTPFCLFASVRKILAEEFFKVWAHIFIGACGISVRAIAPFLLHKSKDPPVIVIDPSAEYVISLISGHWGGGNDLARHLAQLLKARAVLSTASDAQGSPALDLHIRQAGLRILDWPGLAAFQGRILRGERSFLYDPGAFLGSPDWLENIGAPADAKNSPLIVVDWKRHAQRRDLLRLAPPLFCLGLGFRKGVKAEEMLQAFQQLCASLNLASESVAVCATVAEKAVDVEAQKFVNLIDVKLESFSASQLASIRTPNPSQACAARFSLPAFSVCESAAIAGVSKILPKKMLNRKAESGEKAILYSEKFIFNKRITMALALPEHYRKLINS